MVTSLQELMFDKAEAVCFPVGRFEVTPNSPNTVASRVLFTSDPRQPDADVLCGLGDQVGPVCRTHAQDWGVTVGDTLNSPPVASDPAIRDSLRNAATHQALPHMGMLFVPCRSGISHSEAEYAGPSDLAAGARTLAEVMIELATQPYVAPLRYRLDQIPSSHTQELSPLQYADRPLRNASG
jgi:beta-ureidopropionase / N-carbamoyl-L-amino-acid hydrolase